MISYKHSVVLILLIANYSVYGLSQCKCTSNTDPFPGADTSPASTLSISKDNEIIGQKDFGKLINIGSITILQNLGQVNKQSTKSLTNDCPSGFVPVTNAELDTISKRTDFQQLIGQDYLNLLDTVVIFSSEKSSPTITSGNQAFEYYTLKLENKQPKLGITSSYSTADDKNRKTLCKKQQFNFPVNLEGYEGYDLEEGKTYEFKITNKNIEKYYIQDNNNKISTTQTFSYTHKGNDQWGCATINFKFQVFGRVITGDCLSIWTKPQFAFKADSSIKPDQIKKVTFPNIKANAITSMFFDSGTSPISPIINDSSSLYLYYSEKTTNALKVMKLSNEGVQIGNTIDTQEIGNYPLDIVSTHFGFVVFARDTNDKAWISAFNKDGTLRWKRIIINNGKAPTIENQQIKFYKNNKCELPFGMQVMHTPDNGRLNYARGRIQVVFAHYNYFGLTADKKPDNHQGDTMFSLDADTGYDQKQYWTWGTSHSLYQSLHYDGKLLFISVLSDTYPQNISFKVCNIETHECKDDKLVQGGIPGNGGGLSSGRSSIIIDIIGNRNEKFLVYQRKACDGGTGSAPLKNDKNELALIRFNKDLQYISTKPLIEGEIASRINTIKSVKYGKNILIAYSLMPLSEVQAKYNRQNINEAVDESYILLISGTDGSIISGPTKLDTYQVSAADDWRMLEDGRIAYTYVMKDGTLNFYYTSPLTTPAYPNPIQSSDTVYGFKSYENVIITPTQNNFNNVCVQPGDTNYSTVDNNTGRSNNNDNTGNPIDISVSNSFRLRYILIGLFIYILI